jgi:hypothetical protein
MCHRKPSINNFNKFWREGGREGRGEKWFQVLFSVSFFSFFSDISRVLKKVDGLSTPPPFPSRADIGKKGQMVRTDRGIFPEKLVDCPRPTDQPTFSI